MSNRFKIVVFACVPPAKAGTPNLHPNLDPGVIPIFAVVADGVFFPGAFGFGTIGLLQIFRRAAPGPFCPQPHVTMMDRVVVNVINRREEVPLRTHEPLGGPVKHLSAARVFLAIPGVAGASMETPEFVQEFEDMGGFHQRVIVIRQHVPGNGVGGVLFEDIEQRGREVVHALQGKSDVVRVFVAGCGDEKMQMGVVRTMRRRMPRALVLCAPGEDFFALFRRELPPNVTRLGHVSSKESRLQPAGLSHGRVR